MFSISKVYLGTVIKIVAVYLTAKSVLNKNISFYEDIFMKIYEVILFLLVCKYTCQ